MVWGIHDILCLSCALHSGWSVWLQRSSRATWEIKLMVFYVFLVSFQRGVINVVTSLTESICNKIFCGLFNKDNKSRLFTLPNIGCCFWFDWRNGLEGKAMFERLEHTWEKGVDSKVGKIAMWYNMVLRCQSVLH